MKLVNVTDIAPSTYNPRVADPERLDLIELSLRKLGFLLPLYATPDGEIISGHQRHHVACRMGVTQVPLEVTRSMDLAERKGVNVVFNRATNDLGQSDTVADMNARMQLADVRKLAEDLPDKAVDAPEFYPCLHAKPHPIAPFLKANKGRWKAYSLNIAKTLRRRGITMPIVATRDYRVVNGIGRLQHGAELGLEQVPVVFVSDEEGKLAEAMLNYLSMDFDIHRRYEDLLRHNSFRRLRQVRNSLGRGFIFAVAGDSTAKAFDIHEAANRERWIKQHGRCVLDFGAGHLHETRILRSLGITVTPFEPYRVNEGDDIDKAESVALAREFLHAMEIPKEWTFEHAGVAQSFNQHVREQLPWYDLVTGAVAHIARHYIPQGGLVYDIGASTGNIGKALEAALTQRQAKLVPIEPNAEMCGQYSGPGKEHLVQMDACRFDYEPFDVAVCYLVMMFMPVGARAAFIAKLRASLKPGGAIVIVDKCEAATGYQATVLWRLTLAGKVAAGVSPEHIIAKELSLGGVQRPLDPAILGENAAEWFRFGEFAGWIITS